MANTEKRASEEMVEDRRAAKADTRIIQLGSTPTAAIDPAVESKNVKTAPTEGRAKKRTPIAVQRDDDDFR